MDSGSTKRKIARERASGRVAFTKAVVEQSYASLLRRWRQNHHVDQPAPTRFERRDDLSPLSLRVTASGERSFTIRVRIKGEPQPIRLTYHEPATISNLSDARAWAIRLYGECKKGMDPRAEKRAREAEDTAQREHDDRHSFEKVAAAYLKTNGVFKHKARGWKPRTYVEYARTINSRLVPRWKGRVIHTITRDEIADFVAEVAEAAPVTANRVLAVRSALMSWYQTQRRSGFTSPIVRGMAPTEETARDRILSDDELRHVWHVAGKTGTFGSIVRTLLLTGARRSEVAAMRHSQIGKDGIWALPPDQTKNREPLFLPLARPALDVVAAQDRIDHQDLVFSLDGEHAFQNWGHTKADFDKRILWRLRAQARVTGGDPSKVKPPPDWRLHDLRRTARSLMARAKVRPDHAERVLNHKIGGVEAVYDRHSYEDEKREALEALAALLVRIVTPARDKVVQLPDRSAAR